MDTRLSNNLKQIEREAESISIFAKSYAPNLRNNHRTPIYVKRGERIRNKLRLLFRILIFFLILLLAAFLIADYYIWNGHFLQKVVLIIKGVLRLVEIGVGALWNSLDGLNE
jgi:hypothetical protein